MKTYVSIRSEAGLTLVELLIGFSAAIVLSLLIATNTFNQQKGANAIEFRKNVAETHNSLNSVLSNPEACKRSFGGYLPGANDISQVYQATKSGADNGWDMKSVFAIGTDAGIGRGTELEKIELLGAVPPRNEGELRALFHFVQKKSSIGPQNFSREVVLRVRTDEIGRVVHCHSFGTANVVAEQKTVCTDTAVSCADAADHCLGDTYMSSVGGCLCQGTKTTGVSVTGKNCSPVASSGPNLESGGLYNGKDTIEFRFQLKEAGAVHVAVFETDPGSLTPAQVKAYAAAAPVTPHVGGATMSAAAGTPSVVAVSSLPNYQFYTVYTVAERNPGALDGDVRKYEKVLPRKLSIMNAPNAVISNVRYYVSYPDGYYDSGTLHPALLHLSGHGEMSTTPGNAESGFLTGPTRMIKSSVPDLIDQGINLPFIAIIPQCNNNFYNCWGWADINLGNGLMNLVLGGTHPRVDPKRVYLYGFSTGGAGTWHVAMRHASKIAAFISISPVYIATGAHTTWPAYLKNMICTLATEKVAVWMLHNSNDVNPNTLPENSSELQQALGSCPGLSVVPHLTMYPGTRWPASENLAIAPYSDKWTHHNAEAYTLKNRYVHYDSQTVHPTATPWDPMFTNELAMMSGMYHQPISSVWDWLLLWSKP